MNALLDPDELPNEVIRSAMSRLRALELEARELCWRYPEAAQSIRAIYDHTLDEMLCVMRQHEE